MSRPGTGLVLLRGYGANRALLILVLAFAALYVLAWDLVPYGLGDWSAALVLLGERLGLNWAGAFLERSLGDPFRVGMFAALVVLLGYGLLQWVGTAADRRCLTRLLGNPARDCGGWIGSFLALIASRPTGLYRRLNRRQALEIHFGFGRTHLLEPLRLGLWAFPVVGFIGTVLGVSQAVKDLPTAMKDDAALGSVLGSLHLAFDTTFIGLVSSVVVMVLLYALESAWTRNEVLADELTRRRPPAVREMAQGGRIEGVATGPAGDLAASPRPRAESLGPDP